MKDLELTLTTLPDRLAVCRLAPTDPLPALPERASFWSVTRTAEELSLVMPETDVDPGWRAERGWRALMVLGPLDFALTGILANLAGVLAEAEISIFAISTFDTDYLLVREGRLEAAIAALRAAGHEVAEQ